MRKPTTRQIKTLHNLSLGMSKRQAMIQAGYSIATANQAVRVMKTESMKSAVETLHDKLVEVGITPEFIAGKMAEWINATKQVNGHEVPDYSTQIKAYEAVKEIMTDEEKTAKVPRRRITLEEFLYGDS